MPAARFIVSGKVQGVFFRASTRKQALELGLDGYARNLPDGNVEVLASGDSAALETLGLWLQKGPSTARVAKVRREASDEAPGPGFRTD